MQRLSAWLRSVRRSEVDRWDVVLMVAFVMLVGPWVNEISSQPVARYLLTGAIVETGSVELDAYQPALGRDLIRTNGHVYSDKAPLQPLLGVPVLAAAEALGVPSASSYSDAESIAEWAHGNVGAWTQTLVFAVLPAAALLPLMRRHARRFVDDGTATVCAVALGASTMILLFSSYLYAHVLAAFLAFAAWHVVSSDRGSTGWRLGIAGLLAAIGVAVEYPVLAAVAILALWVWWKHGFWRAVAFGIPTVIAGCGILVWNKAVYGVLSTSYGHKPGTPTFIGVPKLYNTFEIFFGRKGFIFTPIVLLAVAGLAVALWQRRPGIAVPAGVLLVVYLLQASWPNPWGGETANPRYMLLALPFLVYPLATARSWVSPIVFRTMVGLGAVTMGLGVMTLELVPDGGVLISTQLRFLTEGEVNTTIFALAFGPIGWLIYAIVAVTGLVLGARAIRSVIAEDRALADTSGPGDDLVVSTV